MLGEILSIGGLLGIEALGRSANTKLFNLALRAGTHELTYAGRKLGPTAARDMAMRALGNKKLFKQLYRQNKNIVRSLGNRSKATGGVMDDLVGRAYNPINPVDFSSGAIRYGPITGLSRTGGLIPAVSPAGQAGSATVGKPFLNRLHTSWLATSKDFATTAGAELGIAAVTRNSIRGASNMAMAFTTLGLGSAAVGWLPGMWSRVPDSQQELVAGTQYIMPRVAYTQRQRALQAIHMSQMNTYSAFGNEASYMHQ